MPDGAVFAELDTRGRSDAAAGRAAFLRWLLALPDGQSPRQAAQDLLARLPDSPQTEAGQVFRACLAQVLLPVTVTPRRRTRRCH